MSDVATVDQRTQEILNREKYWGKGIEDIINNPATKPIPILDRGILVQGARACIYSKEKVGKSVFAVQLGLCCATGLPFLNISVLQKVNVLYLNFEIDDYMLELRILRIKEKLALGEVPNFRKLTLLGEDTPRLDTDTGLVKVFDILETHDSQGFHVDLVMWDCRYKTFEHSENEDDVMKKWCRNMEELIKLQDFTPVVVHHEGKSTIGVGAGSSVFDRWVNTAIRIVPNHWKAPMMPSEDRGIFIGGSYTPGCVLRTTLDFPVHRIVADEVIGRETISKKEEAKNFILAMLKANAGAMGHEKLQEKAGAEGIKRSTFNEAKKELEQEDKISSGQDPDKPGRHSIVELCAEPAPAR